MRSLSAGQRTEYRRMPYSFQTAAFEKLKRPKELHAGAKRAKAGLEGQEHAYRWKEKTYSRELPLTCVRAHTHICRHALIHTHTQYTLYTHRIHTTHIHITQTLPPTPYSHTHFTNTTHTNTGCYCDDENFRHLIITMQDILELRHEQTMTDQDCLALYTLALYLHDLSGPKDRLGGLWTSWFLFPVWRVSFLCFFTLTCLFGDRCLELAKIDLL